MTRQIILNILLVAIFATTFTSADNTAFAGKPGNQNREEISIKAATAQGESPVEPVGLPGTIGLKPPTHKMHTPVMEELAHIHRFHKERVKKLRKHHKKCWVSAKLLLIVCHVALLVCAFLHATH